MNKKEYSMSNREAADLVFKKGIKSYYELLFAAKT